jgi:HD-like signal output (HDOD) protein/DNA-binding CsgD family transcriptional regulator
MPGTATKTKRGTPAATPATARRGSRASARNSATPRSGASARSHASTRGGTSARGHAPDRSGASANNSASGPVAAAAPARRRDEGHGQRLTRAFEALEAFPALAESRNRLLTVVDRSNVSTADIVTALESDVALSIAALRLASQTDSGRGRVDTIVGAVELLGWEKLQTLARQMRTFDFFERASVWEAAPERFRLHALATQHATDQLAAEVGCERRDRLTVASMLHDIGKLVLLYAYPGYPGQVHRGARTPEERIHSERRELGVDHALVGGVLIRRWGLPGTIATTVERHHNPDAEGEAALVRLADMLAHYQQGTAVSPGEMLRVARVLGLGAEELRRVLYELPTVTGQRQRHVDPSPLSVRELGVLQRLAEGKVYKQIAHELTLSTSTVRTHLHNIYGKLGAVDRAQAVLIATERGWL